MSDAPDIDAQTDVDDVGAGPRRGVIDDVRALPRTLVRFFVDGFTHLFVKPIRNGRPRLEGRDVGMKAVVAFGVMGYVLAIVIVVFGGLLRSSFDLTAVASEGGTLSIPRSLLWVIVTLVALSFALLQTGALHSPVWLRLVVLPVSMLALAFIGSVSLSADVGLSRALVVGLIGGALLLVLQVVRWRRSPRWWEFVVVLAIVAAVMAVSYHGTSVRAVEFGIDGAPTVTSLVFFILGQLAIPMTVASGISAAEVGVSASIWSAGFVSRRLSLLVVGGVVVALGAVRLRDSVSGALRDSAGEGRAWMQVVGALVLALLILGLWLLLDRIADRRQAADSGVEQVVGEVQLISIPIAAAICFTSFPTTLLNLFVTLIYAIDREAAFASTLRDWSDSLGGDTAVLINRVIAGIAFIAVAILMARRARRGSAELVGIIGLVLLASYATQDGAILDVFDGWYRAIDAVFVAGIAVLLVTRVVRGRVDTAFLGGVLLLLMLTSLLSARDFVSNPLSIVLGFAGVGFVLLGYVWNYITGAAMVNEDSDRFPRDSRTLLFTALNLFGLTVLAWSALARSTQFGVDLGPFAELGDEVIGVPIVVAGFIALAVAVHRGHHR